MSVIYGLLLAPYSRIRLSKCIRTGVAALGGPVRVEGNRSKWEQRRNMYQLRGIEDDWVTRTGDNEEDWFTGRYCDRSFHIKDGLDPSEWLLLYRIADEKHRDRIEFGLHGAAVGSMLAGCIMFVVACRTGDPNPFQVAPGFMLAGVMAAVYASRLRRYGVVRMYARRRELEEWERWRLSQLALPAEVRSISAPVRQYCIIWKDMFHRMRPFVYTSRQISDAVHRKRWFARAMNGNFLVLGRPWAVHPEYFDEAPDYIFVRRWL